MRETIYNAVSFVFVVAALLAVGYGIARFAAERPAERINCENLGRVW